jgi:hypothetical protein
MMDFRLSIDLAKKENVVARADGSVSCPVDRQFVARALEAVAAELRKPATEARGPIADDGGRAVGQWEFALRLGD